MSAAPTVGNLLLALIYTGNTNTTQTLTTPTGWTKWEAAGGLAGTTSPPSALYYRVAASGDTNTWTWSGTGTTTFWAVFMAEYSLAPGVTWAADQRGNMNSPTAALSSTVTATAANTLPVEFCFAGIGLPVGAGAVTWSGSAGWADSGVWVASRLSSAVRESSGIETTTATATWATSTASMRMVLGTFTEPVAGTNPRPVQAPVRTALFRAANF